MNYSQRLKAARKSAGLTQTELARLVGIDQTSISNLERGKSQGSTHTVSIANACSVSPAWLESGTGEMHEDHVVYRGRPGEFTPTAPFNTWDVDTPLEAAEAFLWFIEEEKDAPGGVLRSGLKLPPGFSVSTVRKLRFDERTLKRHGVTAEKAFCVEVQGNAMEPVLPSGSIVAINTMSLEADDGKMYAIAHDGQLRVRQLYRLPGFGLRLRSYNRSEHEDEDYTFAELFEHKIKVLGKVIWYTVTL